MLAWWCAAVLAAEPAALDVTVVPDPAPPRTAPIRPDPVPPLRLGRGAAVVDGVLDDAVWTSAPVQRLERTATSFAAPDTTLRVALDVRGIVLALDDVPDDHTVSLLVDPAGLEQVWWVVRLRAETATFLRCTLADDAGSEPVTLPARAAPCEEVVRPALRAARQGATWEVGLGWHGTDDATTLLGVGWVQEGPGVAGTWGRGGTPALLPAFVRRQAGVAPPVRVQATPRCGERDVAVTVTPRRRAAAGTWSWARWHHGTVWDRGTWTLDASEPLELTLPWIAARTSVLALSRPDGDGLEEAVSTVIRWRACTVKLATPTFDRTLELAYDLASPVPGLPITVRRPGGPVLATAEIDLPAGTGAVRLTAGRGWPDTVEVVAGRWGGARAIRVR